MPDLAVYFDSHSATDTEAVSARLEKILAAGKASFHVARRVDPHVAAVNVLKPFSFAPDQPLQGKEGWVMFDGALFPEAAPGQSGPSEAAAALAFLLEDFAPPDPARVLALNGQFNVVRYHAEEKKLVVITDRLGSRPLYHWTDGSRHVVASEIKAILAAVGLSPAVDRLGVLELFAFGHNIADRTVLQGITVLPPASILTFDEKGMTRSAYFQYRYRAGRDRTHGAGLPSPADQGREWARRIREVVPRHLQGSARKGIFLSGGLDSRIIAGAIDSTRFPMHSFTFGYPQARDVRFAALLSGILGFNHHVLTYPAVYLSGVIRDVVARTEAAAPFYHATSVLFHDQVAADTDAILVGFCGDVFSGGHLRPAMFRTQPGPVLAEQIFQRTLCAGRHDLASVFQPHVLPTLWTELKENFRATVDEIRDQSGPDTADVWDVTHRQRRFTFSAPKVDRGRFEVLAPLLDNRIVDLVLTLSPRDKRNQLAYKHAIVEGFPDLQKVPWTATGSPIQLNPIMDRLHEAFRLGTRAARKILSKIHIPLPGMDWQFRNIGEEIRRDTDLFDRHLMPYLEGSEFPEDLLSRQGVTQLITDHRAARTDASHLIGTLLTLAVFSDLCTQWTEK